MTGVARGGAGLRGLARTGEWHLDPRVPEEGQAGPGGYAGNEGGRGHLVRRRGAGWGELADARGAMGATFTCPNAAPQAAVFNQSKDL
ncbi:DNA/RNA non-specific endonuclease, partial [Salmonella enterica subsp. enterica serovar Typhimurium]|nr:DNA/RNA non-specific endonuclease [Salmonella enterica subsp. enterica serovar Typhimurium]